MSDDSEMTVGQVADLARVSLATVRRAFDRGEIEGRRTSIEGDRRMRRDSVLEWIKTLEGPAAGN